MNKLLLTTAILALVGFQHPAMAREGEEHREHAHSAKQETATTKPENALKALQNGIAMMADTISEKNQKEMLADGPIMDKWHEEVGVIQEVTASLKHHAATLPDEKKKRLESSLNQLLRLLDDFHIATHNKDVAKAQAEVTKAKGALKLIEANIK